MKKHPLNKEETEKLQEVVRKHLVPPWMHEQGEFNREAMVAELCTVFGCTVTARVVDQFYVRFESATWYADLGF